MHAKRRDDYLRVLTSIETVSRRIQRSLRFFVEALFGVTLTLTVLCDRHLEFQRSVHDSECKSKLRTESGGTDNGAMERNRLSSLSFRGLVGAFGCSAMEKSDRVERRQILLHRLVVEALMSLSMTS